MSFSLFQPPSLPLTCFAGDCDFYCDWYFMLLMLLQPVCHSFDAKEGITLDENPLSESASEQKFISADSRETSLTQVNGHFADTRTHTSMFMQT